MDAKTRFLSLFVAGDGRIEWMSGRSGGGRRRGYGGYLAGDLETDESCDIDAVFDASEKALTELALRVQKYRTAKDALSARLMPRDAGHKQVVIKLKSTTAGGTHLSIRVGTFGDDTKSQVIYEQIRTHLKQEE